MIWKSSKKKVYKEKCIIRWLCQVLFNRPSKTKIENWVLDLAIWRSLMNLTRSIWLNDKEKKPNEIGLREKK